MAAITPIVRPGAVNGAADAAVSLLKVFGGEVLATFEETNVMMGLTRTKAVGGNAVSWNFPVLGTALTDYHTPGENLLTESGYLNTILGGERTISADKLLTSTVFIDKLDMMLNHWDARAEYSRELGRALAKTVDINLLRVLFNAAHVTAGSLFTASPGGQLVISATGDTDPGQFVASIFALKQAFDEDDVPKNDRVLVMSPAQMRLLFASATAVASGLEWINADYTPGGNGRGLREGTVPRLAGFDLVETNHIDTGVGTFGDSTNAFSATADNNYEYTLGAGENIVAMGFQREAIGTVKIGDMAVESEYKIEYQGDVLVAKMALGHGILRPECAGTIQKA